MEVNKRMYHAIYFCQNLVNELGHESGCITNCNLEFIKLLKLNLVLDILAKCSKQLFFQVTRWVIDTGCFVCCENHHLYVEHILSKSQQFSDGCYQNSLTELGPVWFQTVWLKLLRYRFSEFECIKWVCVFSAQCLFQISLSVKFL